MAFLDLVTNSKARLPRSNLSSSSASSFGVLSPASGRLHLSSGVGASNGVGLSLAPKTFPPPDLSPPPESRTRVLTDNLFTRLAASQDKWRKKRMRKYV